MPFARKRFGQHFLEPAWVDKLIAAIAPRADEVFLEIGPGRGALTRPLAARARHVIAVEIDRDLAAALRRHGAANQTIVEGDVLDLDAQALTAIVAAAGLGTPPMRVVGNLPYNVASPILFALGDLVRAGVRFVDATVMLQREVADRLLAPPGTRDYGVLTVLVGHGASVERVLDLPPGAFRPAPKVRSTVVRLVFHAPDPVPIDPDRFVRLVKAVFTRRRKTVANALHAFEESARLKPAEALSRAGLDPMRRPETLTIPELVALSDAFASVCR